MKDFNAMQAAIRAGYNPETARTKAYLIFRDPLVRKYLKSLKVKHVENAQLTEESIIKEIESVGLAVADGELIKTSNRLKALQLLGKNLGMFSGKDIVPKDQVINCHIVIVDRVGQS